MINKINYTTSDLFKDACLMDGLASKTCAVKTSRNFDFLSSISHGLMSNIIATSGKPFIATPRPKAKWTAVDYAVLALKVVFFPITAIYYLTCYICSLIAFRFGVGKNENINEFKRAELRKLGGQEIAFTTEDNVQLEGMFFASSHGINAQTILICSGSHLSYEEYTVPMVDAMLKQGHNVMVFNYRGFGKSAGTPSEKGFNLDTEAAYQYLQSVKGKSDNQITVFGYSMGAAPATDLAANHSIKLVLDRYFSSMKDVARDNGGLIAKWIFNLGGASFDVKEKIKKVQGKIFLLKGSRDTTMKPYHEEYLKSSLKNNSNASFVNIDSTHLHNSNSEFWFHPENTANVQQRNQFQQFLSGL